jgi:U3 small nucleolar RNA-associated protein 7
MIALNPEFVGSLAPPPKLTTARNETVDIPFARLPRMERLKAQGKADQEEDEDMDENSPASDGDNDAEKSEQRAEREKKKMRGKNKSLKRYLYSCQRLILINVTDFEFFQIPTQTSQKCHRPYDGM